MRTRRKATADIAYPLERSIGAQLRFTYRALAQALQFRLEPHGIPIGMWYFLRALWEEDGLSQRELSDRVGAMAPTTVEQLRNMEECGLVLRRRSPADRRKINVFLTAKGRALKPLMLPYAIGVVNAALKDFTAEEVGIMRQLLVRMRRNIGAANADASAVETGPPRARAGKPRLPGAGRGTYAHG
ncbi:MAG TPA: MarR family transcriptional regulator [Alphaproteobacteria bacterium]|nr:MarR family transcriptional regulator [Alphaproteobacteria bacterium]